MWCENMSRGAIGEIATRREWLMIRAIMNALHANDPLHGRTLQTIVTAVVDHFGWDELGRIIDIRCFNFEPSIPSSLKFLRKTPWARKKVEDLYAAMIALREQDAKA